jgi:hypothetical protein
LRRGGVREVIDRIDAELAHALEMTERAFTLEARAAVDVDLGDLRMRR